MRSSRDTVDCVPPELPVKLRVKSNNGPTHRPTSHFDNSTTPDPYISSSTTSVAGSHSSVRSSCTDSYMSCNRFGMIGEEGANFGAMNRRADKPPLLPPKKKSVVTVTQQPTIMAYMQNVGGYYTPTEAALSMYRASVHTYHYSQEHRQHQSQTQRQVEMSFMEHRSFDGSKCSASSGSDESVWSSGSHPSVLPHYSTITKTKPGPAVNSKLDYVPPLLPPKTSQRNLTATSLSTTRSNSPLRPVPAGPPSDSGVSSQSGGSSPSSSTKQDKKLMKGPLDSVDMSQWIVVKNDSEKGPEIVGGTVDALLVKATEVSKTGKFIGSDE